MSGAVTLASDVLPYSLEVPIRARNDHEFMERKAIRSSSEGGRTAARRGFGASEYSNECETVGAGFRGLERALLLSVTKIYFPFPVSVVAGTNGPSGYGDFEVSTGTHACPGKRPSLFTSLTICRRTHVFPVTVSRRKAFRMPMPLKLT